VPLRMQRAAGRPSGALGDARMLAAVIHTPSIRAALTVVLLAASLAGRAALAQSGAATPAAPLVTVTKITWLASDLSPRTGSGRASGVAGRVVAYLGKHWPGVEHEILLANAKRSWQMIENGDEVCRANVVRTPEREKVAYFINTQLTPPPQLIVRRDRLSHVPRNAAGEVLLPRLLADRTMRGAIVDGRRYGQAIDELLAARPARSAVTFYSPKDFGARVLQMLSLDRADYSIDQDMALVMVGNPADLVSVPINGASEFVMAGIACPRTPWGLAAIRGVDKAYGRPEGAADLREGLMHWLTPETQAHYAARFDAFYRERAKPSHIEP